MLSYQHGFHAGNFADVIKHLTLTRLLNYLVQKDKPILYLETHSGRGIYDLTHPQALKTGEAQEGIQRLWAIRKQLNEDFFLYLDFLKHLNPNGILRYYPGSPWIALQALRPQDRLYCCELHHREFEFLQQMPKKGKRIIYDEIDGLTKLDALLPPPERRGLIFIDPSYEVKNDYRQIPAYLQKAFQRFSTGVYCIWYPIVDKKFHEQLLRGFEKVTKDNTLQIELIIDPDMKLGMWGCGLWIINPPYVLAGEMRGICARLCELFNPGKSSFIVRNTAN
jgi:23S rRNA (adenine2030-N6)-methyltransferase